MAIKIDNDKFKPKSITDQKSVAPTVTTAVNRGENTKPVQLKLTAKDHRQLKSSAAQFGFSMSDFVVEAERFYRENH